MPLDPSVLVPEEAPVTQQKAKVSSNLDAILASEGAEHLAPVVRALYAQESGSGANAVTSTDGARGPMQIMPATFSRLAKSGESIDNPDDNLRVGVRLVKALGDKFNNDPARIAAGYFSGEGNVIPTGDQILRKDAKDGNGKSVSSYVQDVLRRVGDAAIPSAQAATKKGYAPWPEVEANPAYKALKPEQQEEARLEYFKQNIVPQLQTDEVQDAWNEFSQGSKKSGSLLEEVKKAAGWREGENFKAPEGVTDATFSAGIPTEQSPTGPKVPNSVLDGSPMPETPRSVAETGGVPLEAARLKQLQSIARDQPKTAAKIAAQDNWAGQAMRAVLEQQGIQVERIKQGDNMIAPNRQDMAARVDLARQAELTPGGEDNAKIAYNQKGSIGKNIAHVTQGVEQGALDIRDGVIGAGQAALRLVGDTQLADELQRHQESLKGRAANLDLPSSAEYGAKTAQSVVRSITMNVPGLMTGATAPALTAMGLQSFGQEFGNGRAAGMTDAEATVRAGIFAAAEIVGERFGLGETMQGLKAAAKGMPTQEVVGHFARALAKEIPGEELTSTVQFAADKFMPQGLAQRATLDDYLRVVGDTLVQTILQSGVMMGGGAAASKAVQAIDAKFPQAALGRALREQIENSSFDQSSLDRAARLSLDPNADGNTVIAPEAVGFAPGKPAPAGSPEPAVPAAESSPMDGSPLDGAPITNPIASELADLEGVSNGQAEAGTGTGVSTAAPAQEEQVIAGRPASQHTPASLNFLMTAHPDQVVRDQAALALASKQSYPVVTQTRNGPVESQVDSALKGQLDDNTVHILAEGSDTGRLTFSTPSRTDSFAGPAGSVAGTTADFGQLLESISGRGLVVVGGSAFRGAVADRKHIFLSREQGREGLVAVAFHEVRHALKTDHADLSDFWSDAVHQHLKTDDSSLLSFLSGQYADPYFSPERIATMRAKGRTDSQILNAILAAHPNAQMYEDTGYGSRRDWAIEELEADALGDAANRDGVLLKALDHMAKVDIGLVKQFAQFVQGLIKKAGFGSKDLVKGSTEAEVKARLEALDRAAAEVLGRYASRTQNQKRMQGATPAELLLIKKSHPDSVVRDMAEAELKKRETEAAYQQKEEQKAGEKENFKEANKQAKLDQAEAEAKAAGTDDGTPTAMAQAMASMKKDVQSLRRQLAKEMKKAAATARGNAQVRSDQLADNEAGRFSTNREQTLPTRWPTSKRMTPSVNDPMLADLATLRETPKLLEQAVNAIAEEPGMRTKARNVESKLDAILDKMVSNLLWLHDQVPAEIRERSKLWYDGAGEIATKWAKQYDKSRSQTAGILAVLSPQKDWFMNVTMAERILDVLSTQMDHKFDAKMRGAAFKFLVKDFAKAEDKRENTAAFNAVKDKTLKEAVETGDLRQAGLWLRAYDEAYHDSRHAVIHPEGDFGDNAMTMKGTETLRAWGDFGALGKAASIFLDGSAENINQKLGGEHKVRNFYNNIFAPKDARFTTIDTHAVAADLLRPLAGMDKPVTENFGSSGGSDLTGVSGTYPIHYEVYKRAAEQRGVLPREMQSITWEAIRGLFTEGFKGKKENLKAIDNIWREVDKGKMTVAQARQQIVEMAGGMEHPDWWNGQEPAPSGRAKSYSQTRPAFEGNKIVFEVAPDPHNTDLTNRWNDLPDETKARISYDIAWDTAGKLLGYYNSDTIKGELHTQVGGYLENTNPSFSLWMNKYASMVKVQEIANTLGYVLNQDSMVIGSPKKFKGGFEMGLVRVTNVSDTNAKKVYDDLRAAILDEDGNPLINGHTTAEGSMVILVDLGTEDAIRQRVAAHVSDDHGVGSGSTFVQWPERGEDDYGYRSGQGEAGGGGAEAPLREYAHNLRRETTTELEKRIAARFSTARAPRFYSQLARQVEQAPDRVFGPASQVKAWLQSNAGKLGIKQDEIQWTGINDWLDLQGKAKVSKSDVANYLAQNGVQVEEVEKGDAGYNEDDPQLPAGWTIAPTQDRRNFLVKNEDGRNVGKGPTREDAIADAHSGYPEAWEGEGSTKYESYTLPGGENYRELLLTLPGGQPKEMDPARMDELRDNENRTQAEEAELQQLYAAYEQKAAASKTYHSGHWVEANILAHVRFNDRTDADGNKVLFIEELQSDWGQAGKKGGFGPQLREGWRFNTLENGAIAVHGPGMQQPYGIAAPGPNATAEAMQIADRFGGAKTSTVPAAPFVTDTKAWLSLGIKRMVAYAVENGYDKVAFVNGEQSAERYDLSKKVEAIEYVRKEDGGGRLLADDRSGNTVVDKRLASDDELESYIGKEAAAKLLQQSPVDNIGSSDLSYVLNNADLQVGGSGMKAFYDKIVPQTVSDVLKKLGGGKVEEVSLQTRDSLRGTEEWTYGISSSIDSDDYYVADRTKNWENAAGPFKDHDAAHAWLQANEPALQTQQLGFTITPALREKVQGGMPLFSNNREQWNAVRAAWLQIADEPAAFKFPKSDSESLAEVMANIDPSITVSQRGVMGEAYNKGVRERYVVRLPGGKDAEVSVKANGRMWVNASQLKAATGAGTKLYQGLLNWAYNTNKVLVGDPYGVSDLATFRRTEQMLSAALKFGTTDFMEPSNTQRTPKAFKDSLGHTDGVIEKFADLNWEQGNDSANLASLINVSYTNIINLVPEVQDVQYDFDSDTFKHIGSDRVVTRAEWQVLADKLATALRGNRGVGVHPGGIPTELLSRPDRGVTLQRAVLTSSLLRGTSGEGRGSLLAGPLRKLRELRAGRGGYPVSGDQAGSAGRDNLRSETEDGAEPALQGILYSRIRDAIDRTIANVDHAVDGLSNLPNQFDYLSDRYLALGKIARVDEIVSEIRKGFDGVPQADKAAAYTYLTTRGASPSIIGNPEARAMAKRIKDTINYVGDALVARGLLDPAARAHYKDQYLPRMYLKHLMNEADWKAIGAGKKPTDMGYLKHRKDIAPEVRELVLGEVKDPAFLSANAIGRAMRDVAILDWMGKISQNNDWVFPKVFVNYNGQRVSAYWLRAEADRIDNQSAHYTPANQVKAKALTANMRQLANQALGNLQDLDHTKYKQIPDTMRYGLLRGMWLRKEIYNDIMGASQLVNADPTWFEDWFGFGGKGTRLTQWWKFSKVALNPPGQVRNFLSNMVMLQLSGVGLHKLPFRLIQAAREITNNGPHWKIAKKYGVTESTFTAQELHRVKRDLLALEAKVSGTNPLTWLMNAGAHFLEGVSDLYQFSEALGKTIKIIDEMENGKSEAEAAIEAQKWLFDYSLVPQSIRIARNSPVGMPFITYQIKAAPRLLEVAMKYPWRFLPWVGLFYGMEAYVASTFGVDEDELKKLKKALPEWLQNRSHTVFLPTRDADGRVQVADIGYFFPWTFFSQTGKHLADGDLKKAFVDDIGGQFSAPIIGSAAALMANYNTFTKKPIYEEADPVAYKAAAIANYTYDLMAPPFLSSHGFASPMGLVDKQYGGKMVQAMTGTTNKFGDPKATEAQALAGLLGFNFYGMDPEHTRATNLMVSAKKIQAAEQQLKYKLMDRGLTDEQRAKHMNAYRERMIELAGETQKLAEESEVPEQLKARK